MGRQEYWQQKSARKAQTEERLRQSLYGRAEEQQAFQCAPPAAPTSHAMTAMLPHLLYSQGVYSYKRLLPLLLSRT